MTRYWIGVASREHVLQGITGGFCQVCHGKRLPLQRMKPDDWIVYYSPVEKFQEKVACRKFTAIGKILSQEPYQFAMTPDFTPWRHDVQFVKAKEIFIEPLIPELSFIKDKKHWGFPFRRGFFEISEHDFKLLAHKMGVSYEKIKN